MHCCNFNSRLLYDLQHTNNQTLFKLYRATQHDLEGCIRPTGLEFNTCNRHSRPNVCFIHRTTLGDQKTAVKMSLSFSPFPQILFGFDKQNLRQIKARKAFMSNHINLMTQLKDCVVSAKRIRLETQELYLTSKGGWRQKRLCYRHSEIVYFSAGLYLNPSFVWPLPDRTDNQISQ